MLVGGVLVAGLGIFLVGAAAWRLDYQRPLEESLPVIHRDRHRWAWIHSWMVAAMLVTPAGLAGLAVILEEPTATVLTAMAAAVYVFGGVCWIASLAFRLAVVPWAAEQTVTLGDVPDGFAANDRWAGPRWMADRVPATSHVKFVELDLAVRSSSPQRKEGEALGSVRGYGS